MARIPRFAWRRALIYTHRWLGIAGCLLFLVWFASGVVMIYARMPNLTAEERLSRLPPLAFDQVAISPDAAVARVGRSSDAAVRLGMFEGRPVYRFDGPPAAQTVFADTGDPVPEITEAQAVEAARPLSSHPGAGVRLDAKLDAPDQWTVSGALRSYFPLHRVALDDDAGTQLYVSARTGEPVGRTTKTGRRWGYLGAVLHWLYFTPLRRHGALWSNVVIWLSIGGSVMCLSGLIWGIWRFAPITKYRLRRSPSATPYAGMMRWHHYAGLLFGLTTFTWIFSGLLSMDPWDWHPGNAPTEDQRRAVEGSLPLETLTAPRMRSATAALVNTIGAREVEVLRFQGRAYLLGYRLPPAGAAAAPWTNTDLASFLTPSAPLEQRIVALDDPRHAVFERFPDEAMLTAARAAMPAHPVSEAVLLHAYDAYYYDRHGVLPLPVLRVRFRDPVDTWLYLDPRRGAIALKEERWSRVNRWLYHGLHSLDFPFLYWRRPLWDVVVVALSVGGLLSTLTALVPAWRRLRRLAGLSGIRLRGPALPRPARR